MNEPPESTLAGPWEHIAAADLLCPASWPKTRDERWQGSLTWEQFDLMRHLDAVMPPDPLETFT